MKTLKSCPFESPAFGDICTGAAGGISEPARLRALALHIHPSATCPGRDRAVGGRPQAWAARSDTRLPAAGRREATTGGSAAGSRPRPASLRQRRRRLRPLGSRFWVCFGIKVLFEATRTRISVGHVPSPRGDLRWRHVRPGRRLPAFCLQPLGSCCKGTARKCWAWCESKSPPACDWPGQMGSPGATGEAQGARPPQAAMPQCRRRPLFPGAGCAALARDPQAHSGQWGPATPTGTSCVSSELPAFPEASGGLWPEGTMLSLRSRTGVPSLRVARGHFQILLSTDGREHLPPGTLASGPRAHAGPCLPAAPAGLNRLGGWSVAAVPARPASPRGSRGQPRPRVSPA